jgi:TPR repeat protein
MVAASQGDDTARAHIGTMFVYGIGVPQDNAQALFWLSLAAEHNNPEADTMLGLLSEQGRIVKQDWMKAFQFYQRGADQGNAIAQTGLGKIYLDPSKGVVKSPDYTMAMKYFTMAAYQNEPESEYDLGFMYYTGMGVKQDYAGAVSWFTKSANQGNSAAASFLGTQYDNGLGVPQDNAKAILYFRLSAVQGNLQGLALLGEKYLSGSGVKQDTERAYALLNISAGQVGSILHDRVVKARDTAAGKLSPVQLAEAQTLAAYCATARAFALCLDDSISVADQAADPPTMFAKLQAKAQATKAAAAPASPVAPTANSQKPKMVGNGTGFFVSANGYMVTAAHVTADCPDLRAFNLHLKLVAQDRASDVALLSSGEKAPAFVKLRGGRGPRVGEPVVVIGFPLQGLVGEDPIVTTGSVSSQAGLQNDRRQIQISAPIQPGNSGGPVLGEDGALLGVAVSSISTLKAAELIGGSVPQNVNFAVSTATLQGFLNAHQIPYVLADDKAPQKSSVAIAGEATRYTVMLECWK